MDQSPVRRFLPWVVATALFMEQLDSTIVNTAIPSMAASLQQAGFGKIAVVSRPSQFLLWAVASKAVCDDAAITALAQRHIPGFTAKAAP
jgi:hypothetical protein